MENANGKRERLATRNDVAQLAGVSTAVVSYVLNDGPRPVARATRERVLAAMNKLNYTPNAAARAFRLQRTNTIGLLVPDISNPFFAELASAVEDVASTRGYAVVMASTNSAHVTENDQIRAFASRQLDAVLIIGRTNSTDLSPFTDTGTQVVAFDRIDGDIDLPSVCIDDFMAATAGISHLISHGHSQIAILCGPRTEPAARSRFKAWEMAVNDTSSNLVLEADYTRVSGYTTALEFLARQTQATAIFIASDIQAIGALRAFTEEGIQVPRQLAIVSFDGTQEAEFSNPPLTVIRQPLQTMAEEAIKLALYPEERAKGIHRVVPHDLIVRQSCGH